MKKGGYKRGKKLAAQILICAALFCFLWMGQEEELPLGGKTAKAFHQKLTEDYKIEQILAQTMELGQTALEKPAQIYARLRLQNDDKAYMLPTDQAVAKASSRPYEQGSDPEGAKPMVFTGLEELQVYAANAGVVSQVKVNEQEETFVLRLAHENQTETVYQGRGRVYVREKQRVGKGTLLASVTQKETNGFYCLSFSIYEQGEIQDPAKYLKEAQSL